MEKLKVISWRNVFIILFSGLLGYILGIYQTYKILIK